MNCNCILIICDHINLTNQEINLPSWSSFGRKTLLSNSNYLKSGCEVGTEARLCSVSLHNFVCTTVGTILNQDEKILAMQDCKWIRASVIRLIDFAKWIEAASTGLIWRGLCDVFLIKKKKKKWVCAWKWTDAPTLLKKPDSNLRHDGSCHRVLAPTSGCGLWKGSLPPPPHKSWCHRHMASKWSFPRRSELNILYSFQLRNASLFLVSWSLSLPLCLT